jgi:hypothetical protein
MGTAYLALKCQATQMSPFQGEGGHIGPPLQNSLDLSHPRRAISVSISGIRAGAAT